MCDYHPYVKSALSVCDVSTIYGHLPLTNASTQTSCTPKLSSSNAQDSAVAPVVKTSSTKRIFGGEKPFSKCGRTSNRPVNITPRSTKDFAACSALSTRNKI